MKIDRLVSIIVALLQRERISARELAERFEVSVRTILRDVEAINQAGIPIESWQGNGGGFGIAEGFRLKAGVLSEKEAADVIVAVRGMAAAVPHSNAATILEKFATLIPRTRQAELKRITDRTVIDLSDWGDGTLLKEKIAMLRDAMDGNRVVSFRYANARGETRDRLCEPHVLVNKSLHWYLYGWCRQAEEFRLFRLVRMGMPSLAGEVFEPRPFDPAEMPWNREWHAPERLVDVSLRFRPHMRQAAIEAFGMEAVPDPAEWDGGPFLVHARMQQNDWLAGYVLGFGKDVEVLAPESLRNRVREIVLDMCRMYGEGAGAPKKDSIE